MIDTVPAVRRPRDRTAPAAHSHVRRRARLGPYLTRRPDAVLVEMGLPVWRPEGVAHVATYGATRANAQATAEVIGLIR